MRKLRGCDFPPTGQMRHASNPENASLVCASPCLHKGSENNADGYPVQRERAPARQEAAEV